jgi:hypothetical protein
VLLERLDSAAVFASSATVALLAAGCALTLRSPDATRSARRVG